jgi:hypothetical protein
MLLSIAGIPTINYLSTYGSTISVGFYFSTVVLDLIIFFSFFAGFVYAFSGISCFYGAG